MMTAIRPLSSWAPVLGDWELAEARADFRGSRTFPQGVLLGDGRLNNGVVKAGMTFDADGDGAAGSVLLGYEPPGARYITAGLGGGNGEAYVIAEYTPQGWRRLEGIGKRVNLQPNRCYAVEVEVDGQRIALTVDGVRVLTYLLPQPLPMGQVGLFGWGAGAVTFDAVEVSPRPPSAFVVMQFTPPFDELFEDVIRPVCAEMDIEAYRASDIYRPGVIVQDIIQGLAESQVVIAEITPANPNVFYEVGYSHALGKPTILLANRAELSELPFDLRGFRVVFYDDTIRGKSSVECDLRRHLRAIARG